MAAEARLEDDWKAKTVLLGGVLLGGKLGMVRWFWYVLVDLWGVRLGLFRCEAGMLSLDPKWLLSKIYDKNYGTKNSVKRVEMLKLHRYTMAVITWLYLNARMRISKALRK